MPDLTTLAHDWHLGDLRTCVEVADPQDGDENSEESRIVTRAESRLNALQPLIESMYRVAQCDDRIRRTRESGDQLGTLGMSFHQLRLAESELVQAAREYISATGMTQEVAGT